VHDVKAALEYGAHRSSRTTLLFDIVSHSYAPSRVRRKVKRRLVHHHAVRCLRACSPYVRAQISCRVYFEKVHSVVSRLERPSLNRLPQPRTTVGWKGLINDPQLNGSFQINKGLRLARGVLLEIVRRLLPLS
jgi:hypothetical protein